MNKTISNVEMSLKSIRAGRASPSMVDRIVVEYYGTPTPLAQMAQISTPDAASLLIQPYDKSA